MDLNTNTKPPAVTKKTPWWFWVVIVLIVLGAAGAVYILINGPTGTIALVRERYFSNSNKSVNTNADITALAKYPKVTLPISTGKYNGGLDDLALDFKDVPASLGVFDEYGATTGYEGQDGSMVDQNIALAYSLQISPKDFSATIPQSFDLYVSPAKAQTDFDLAKTMSEEVSGPLLTYSDIKLSHFYTIDTKSYEGDKGDNSVYFMVIDSNLLVTLSFRFPKSVSVSDLKPLVDIVIGRLNNYQPLTTSELDQQAAALAMFDRDDLRQSEIKNLESGISMAAYNETTKQRDFPTEAGALTRSADGNKYVLTGSIKTLFEAHPEFAERIKDMVPPFGLHPEEYTYKYLAKPAEKSFIVYVKMETPGQGWYYAGIDVAKNMQTEGYSQTEPK